MLEKPEGVVRLATYNIRHGAYEGKREYTGHPDLVAETCVELNADILALQEVDSGMRRSGRKNLAELAAQAAGMQAFFAPTLRRSGGLYGNALLVRGDILEPQVLTLPHGYRFGVKKEPRNFISAVAVVADRHISVTATHLSTQRWVSRNQLPQVVAAQEDKDGPGVIMGDFNRKKRGILPFIGPEWEVIDAKPTFPANHPRKLIDHVAIRGLSVRAAQVVRMRISDHRARIVDVE